jgi:hypothetical protein
VSLTPTDVNRINERLTTILERQSAIFDALDPRKTTTD